MARLASRFPLGKCKGSVLMPLSPKQLIFAFQKYNSPCRDIFRLKFAFLFYKIISVCSTVNSSIFVGTNVRG